MNPLPFYSVEDNYTTNLRRERLNSLYCLGELEAISRNSSYKREWEPLIPEYPFCFANGVPTSHSLLKYSLNEEKNKLSAAEVDVEKCSGSLWCLACQLLPNCHHYCVGTAASPRPQSCPTLGTGSNALPCAHRLLFSMQENLGSVTHNHIIVKGCCKSSGHVSPISCQEGHCASVTCSRLSRWRRLRSAPCTGCSCQATGSSAGGWKVLTKSCSKALNWPLLLRNPALVQKVCFLLWPYPMAVQESVSLLSLFLLNVSEHQSVLETVL